MATPAAAVLIASLLTGGVAVAVAGPDSAAAQPLRLLVKLAHPLAEPPLDQPADIARLASDAAGLPVAYGAAAGADWHALRLSCIPAECDAAVRRLQAAKSLFAHVERDERRRRHSP